AGCRQGSTTTGATRQGIVLAQIGETEIAAMDAATRRGDEHACGEGWQTGHAACASAGAHVGGSLRGSRSAALRTTDPEPRGNPRPAFRAGVVDEDRGCRCGAGFAQRAGCRCPDQAPGGDGSRWPVAAEPS